MQRETLCAADGNPLTQLLKDGSSQQDVSVYLSCAVGPAKSETSADLDTFLGTNNYSYNFMLKGYMHAFDELGIEYQVLAKPEYISDIRRNSPGKFNLHFGFYPPEEVRLLKGAYNIFVTAWEFERLRHPYECTDHHAFNDAATMLGLADEVWSLSTFGANAIKKSGLRNVKTVPSPVLIADGTKSRNRVPSAAQIYRRAATLEHISWVPLAIAPGPLQPSLSARARARRSPLRFALDDILVEERPQIFMSMLNVYDYRKQIKPALEAFARVAKVMPNAMFLLKISFPHRAMGDLNEFLLRHQIDDVGDMAPFLVSDRVWLTADVFTREELNALYDLSAFYVSTSHGEGQNLPLLEAMARGVVPMSVDHTAMSDYISPENSVVIPSSLGAFTPRLRERYRMHNVNTFYVSPIGVQDAFETALDIDDAAYCALSEAAQSTVRARYGSQPFGLEIDHAIGRANARLAGSGHGATR